MKQKTCSKCERTRYVKYFHKHSKMADGLNSVCMDCRREESAAARKAHKKQKKTQTNTKKVEAANRAVQKANGQSGDTRSAAREIVNRMVTAGITEVRIDAESGRALMRVIDTLELKL